MLLTRSLIEANDLRYKLGWQLYEQGKALYTENCAQVVAFDHQKATCSVRDKKEVFTVVIAAERRNNVQWSCTCPRAVRYNVCRHMAAAALATRDYLRDVAEKNWRYQIELALETTPRATPSPPPTIEEAILLMGLHLERRGDLTHTCSLYAYVLQAPALVAQVAASPNPPQAALSALLADRDWRGAVRPLDATRPLHYVNLSAEANDVVKLMIATRQPSYFGSVYNYHVTPNLSDLISYLPTLQRLNVPLFLWKERQPSELLIIKDTPVLLKVALAEEKGVYELQAGIEIDGNVYSNLGRTFKILSTPKGTWTLAGRTLAPIANPKALNLLQTFPLRIPVDEAEEFRQRYFRAINERVHRCRGARARRAAPPGSARHACR